MRKKLTSLAGLRQVVWTGCMDGFDRRHQRRTGSMDLGIKGKTALVLGAAGGLGSAISEALAAEGVNLALADMNGDALESTLQAVRKYGVKAMTITWNLADLASIEAHVASVEA